MGERPRCNWSGSDPLYVEHHDVEWGVPVADPRALWEHLVLDGFQAGLAWIVVLRKREGLREAFFRFDPAVVARMTREDIERLLVDARVIRSRAKIEAAVANARAYLEMQEAGEGFDRFAWSFVGGRPVQNNWRSAQEVPAQTALSADIAKALKAKGFKFVGPVSVYAWMQAVGLVNDHITCCFRHDEVEQLGRIHRL